VTGSGAVSGDVRGTVSSDEEARQLYPNNDLANPLANGTVYVEIESEYCQGWQSFFERRTQGAIEQECGNNSTVTATLKTVLDPVFGAVVTSNAPIEGKPTITGPIRDGINATSASDEIDDEISMCSGGGCTNFSSGDELYSGTTYYTEDDTDLNQITANVGSGDVDIVINATGEVDLGSINVDGTNGRASIYIKADNDVFITDNVNSGGDPERLIMYVHSDIPEIHFVGNEEFRGGLYAPKSEFDGDNGKGNEGCKGGGGGAVSLTGAVVVDTFCFQNGDFTHDEKMDGIDVDIGVDTIRYLHVSENTIEIDLG